MLTHSRLVTKIGLGCSTPLSMTSLKVVKIYTKMNLNCKNFGGQMSGGGGQMRHECRMGGGIDKIFANWGTPIPPRENPERHTPLQNRKFYSTLCTLTQDQILPAFAASTFLIDLMTSCKCSQTYPYLSSEHLQAVWGCWSCRVKGNASCK